MRILTLSDTHNYLPKLDLDGIDLVLFAGDFSARHKDDIYSQLDDYINYFTPWILNINKQVPCYWISGNHEVFMERLSLHVDNQIYPYNIDDRNVIFGQDNKFLKIHGFPHTPTFHNWAFNSEDTPDDMGKKCDRIPLDTDILLSHGPPYGIMDVVPGRLAIDGYTGNYIEIPSLHAGSKELAKRIDIIKPKLVVFGHLHHNFGIEEHNGVKYVACSSMDENFNKRKPIIVEI